MPPLLRVFAFPFAKHSFLPLWNIPTSTASYSCPITLIHSYTFRAVSQPPEPSVTSTTIRRRITDVILHDDGQCNHIYLHQTACLHSCFPDLCPITHIFCLLQSSDYTDGLLYFLTASPPPQASVTSTMIRKRRADVILRDDGKCNHIYLHRTAWLQTWCPDLCPPNFILKTMYCFSIFLLKICPSSGFIYPNQCHGESHYWKLRSTQTWASSLKTFSYTLYSCCMSKWHLLCLRERLNSLLHVNTPNALLNPFYC